MSVHDKRKPKGPPPPCPRCKSDENVVPATNFGVPTGEWWCRGPRCAFRFDPPKPKETK